MPQQSLVGCFEVTSLKWTPAVEDKINSPLERFELSSEPVRDASSETGPFRVHTLARSNPWESLWIWRPSIDREGARITLSHGLGGFRGSLYLTKTGELIGKLKEYCDYRCEWKRETVHIHARRIPCTPAKR